MLGDVLAPKYSKTCARTCSILKKFAFDTTLLYFSLFLCCNITLKGLHNTSAYSRLIVMIAVLLSNNQRVGLFLSF